MKFSLFGHEISDDTNPVEAGLGWVVKLQKGDFMGRSFMQKMKEEGAKRLLIGFKMVDKGIPREKYLLFSDSGQEIGFVTSGTLSPTLNEGIGIGYVDRNFAAEGTEIFVDIRGRKAKTRVVKTLFVAAKGK
jgi:aminomethyltransferase